MSKGVSLGVNLLDKGVSAFKLAEVITTLIQQLWTKRICRADTPASEKSAEYAAPSRRGRNFDCSYFILQVIRVLTGNEVLGRNRLGEMFTGRQARYIKKDRQPRGIRTTQMQYIPMCMLWKKVGNEWRSDHIAIIMAGEMTKPHTWTVVDMAWGYMPKNQAGNKILCERPAGFYPCADYFNTGFIGPNIQSHVCDHPVINDWTTDISTFPLAKSFSNFAGTETWIFTSGWFDVNQFFTEYMAKLTLDNNTSGVKLELANLPLELNADPVNAYGNVRNNDWSDFMKGKVSTGLTEAAVRLLWHGSNETFSELVTP